MGYKGRAGGYVHSIRILYVYRGVVYFTISDYIG
jgi:hypothetical protein